MNNMPKYLYHYAPPNNTIERDGLLSTALAKHGWEKYDDKPGKQGKHHILNEIDKWNPGFRRSYAVSVLTEPIPDNAHSDFLKWKARQRLYRMPAAKLLASGIISRIEYSPMHTYSLEEVQDIADHDIDWSRKPEGRLFRDIPHYMLETADGHIPPEYLEVMGQEGRRG